MGRDFAVTYDDFSGGYFVGAVDVKQPKNTWIGDNMLAVEPDGTLMPAALATIRAGYTPGATPSNVAVTRDGSAWGFGVGTTFYAGSTGTPTGNPAAISVSPTILYGRAVMLSANQLMQPTTSALVAFWTAPTTVTGVTVPARMSGLVQFGPFVVGAQWGLSRIFWSNPLDGATWLSTSFYDIGSAAPTISALVVVGNTLYVGKADGWWSVTGVLGSTAVVTQVSPEGPPDSLDNLSGGVLSADGLLLQPGRRVDGTVAMALRGSIMQPIAYAAPIAVGANRVFGQVGMHAALGLPTAQSDFWMRSPTGKWRHYSQLATGVSPASFCDGPANVSTAYTHGTDGAMYHLPISPVDPPLDGTGAAFCQASAQLAEYVRDARFRVRECVAELDLGYTSTNAQRSVSVGVRQSGVPVEGGAVSTAWSASGAALQQQVLSPMSSTAGEHLTLRFRPDEGAPSYTASPLVTLQGVKLRRLVLHCTEMPEGG